MSAWPLNVYLANPPVSRTLAAVVFIFSVLIYVHVLPFEIFHLSPTSLLQLPPQLWRIFTSLLITSPNFGILFDTYFLYVYGAKLEIGSPRFSQRADFFTYILFSYGIILLMNLLIASGDVFAGPLGICFLTSWTRDAWDQPVTLIILAMPAQYLPYAILFITLIMCSPQWAAVQATGLVAAHVFDLLTGLYPDSGIKRSLIITPAWIKKIFGTQSVIERPYGTASNTAAADKAAWGLDLSWKRFGPGRTLGGEGASVERQRPGGLAFAALIMGGFLMICLILGYFFLIPQGGLDGWSWSFGSQKSSGVRVAGNDFANGKSIV